MKKTPWILLITLLSFFGCNKNTINEKQTINPLLGDISFVKKYGHQPEVLTNEDLRISTHLEYVEDVLRQKDVSELSEKLQKQRELLLDLLSEYRTAAIFPRNYDFPDKRVPCFIDKEGRICAVGYLIEKTAGIEAPELINRNNQYKEILEMNEATVDHWVASSGLTKEECAMIQPSYGGVPRATTVSPQYKATTVIMCGVNASLSIANITQLSKGGSEYKMVPALGIITGAAQLITGSIRFTNGIDYNGNVGANKNEKKVSLANMGIGGTTIILSTINLLKNREGKENKVSWNFFSYPMENNQLAVGINFLKTI